MVMTTDGEMTGDRSRAGGAAHRRYGGSGQEMDEQARWYVVGAATCTPVTYTVAFVAGRDGLVDVRRTVAPVVLVALAVMFMDWDGGLGR